MKNLYLSKVNRLLLPALSLFLFNCCDKDDKEVTVDQLGLNGTEWVCRTNVDQKYVTTTLEFTPSDVKISVGTYHRDETSEFYNVSRYIAIYKSFEKNDQKMVTFRDETFIIDGDQMVSQQNSAIYIKQDADN